MTNVAMSVHIAVPMICQACGLETQKRGNGPQKYCEPCSEKKDMERKRLWAQKHPLTKAQLARLVENRKSDKSRVEEIWNKRNAEQAKPITAWEEVDLAWLIRITVPFSYQLSKNHMFTSTRFGHVALRREARASRDEITLLLRETIRKVEVKQNKLWIDIYVQKPNHRGDAINVLDLVCDAIKDAVGLDDRWFCIRRIDWQIVKQDPKMYIGIGQEDVEDSRICSYCGLIMPLAKFGKKSRECRECRAAKRKNTRKPSRTVTAL